MHKICNVTDTENVQCCGYPGQELKTTVPKQF